MNSITHQQIHGLVTSAGAMSRRGFRRQNNQDAFLIDEYLNMFVVADGVSGRAGGEIASALACGQIMDVFETELMRIDSDIQEGRDAALRAAIRHAFRAADRRIICERSFEPFLSQMATTALLAFVDTAPSGLDASDARLYVANAGDSRALLIRLGNVMELTQEHTIAAGLERAGIITEDEAARQSGNSTLYMSLGGNLYDGPDVYSCAVRDGDRIVLMTDGITAVLGGCDVAKLIAGVANEKVAAIRIVNEALELGAGDDVTCLVVDVLQ